MPRISIEVPIALAVLMISSAATAEPVTLDATLDVTCTLVVSDGALAPSSDYTSLSSEYSGGSSASVTVTALGGNPTVIFAAPTVTSTNDVTGVTPQIKYSSLDGASQAYTSVQTSSTASDLSDVYTIDAKIEHSDGFDAGDYSITTVVTCSG